MDELDEDYGDGEEVEEEEEEEEDEEALCTFPDWVIGASFQTLSMTSLYQFSELGGEYTVSNYSCSYCNSAQVAQQISVTRCQEIMESDDEDLTKLIVKTTAGW